LDKTPPRKSAPARPHEAGHNPRDAKVHDAHTRGPADEPQDRGPGYRHGQAESDGRVKPLGNAPRKKT
jgi:hypothetical protein